MIAVENFMRGCLAWFREPEEKKTPTGPDKKKQLKNLCLSLLQNKEFVAAGRIQLLGLRDVEKRLGRKWGGLSKIVYDVVDAALLTALDQKDTFLRHDEYSYLIVFSSLAGAEAEAKIKDISEEIRRQLFSRTSKDMRLQEIASAIGDVTVVTQVLRSWAALEKFIAPLKAPRPQRVEAQLTAIATHAGGDSKSSALFGTAAPKLYFNYVPVWDPDAEKLSRYLAFACRNAEKKACYTSHEAVRTATSASEIFSIDCAVLSAVGRQLARVRCEKDSIILVCPVQYQTLNDYETYARYKAVLLTLPLKLRSSLELMVVGEPEEGPSQQKYWFVKPLKGFCRNIIAEVAFEKNMAFQSLLNAGLTSVCTRVRNDILTEEEIIRRINGFAIRAKAIRFPQTYVMDVNTLSLATSAICAGVNLLSGPGIHSPVLNAGHNDHYSQDELLAYLAQ